MDRGAWKATVHGFARVRHDLVTKPPPPWNSYRIWYGAEMKQWDDRCHKSLSVKKAIQSDKINTKSKILKLSKGWVLAFQCIKEQRTVSHYKLSLGKSKEWTVAAWKQKGNQAEGLDVQQVGRRMGEISLALKKSSGFNRRKLQMLPQDLF